MILGIPYTEQPRLVDPLLLDARSSDKAAEPRKNSFRQELIERDGGCVVEDSLDMKVCAGCHLLAHAKSSEVCLFLFYLPFPSRA